MRELEEIIREEIQAKGAIKFAHFMGLALYHPRYGYYERGLSQTGRAGDFYTSVSVGNLYGQLLGWDIARRLRELGAGEACIVEGGAHDGRLAADVLTFLEEYQPEIFRQIRYTIVEPSAGRAEVQRTALSRFGKIISWASAWDQVKEFRGVCLSNELLDAMPVHVFKWEAERQRWAEWGVTVEADVLCWARLSADQSSAEARQMIPQLPSELLAVLPSGFTFEVSPAAIRWWAEASRRLREGWLMTADYGLRMEEFFVPQRAEGTLRAYARHRSDGSVFERIGEQDLTAHVNFSAVIAAGEAAGLQTETLVTQGLFLQQVLEESARVPGGFPDWTPVRRRQLMSLMHPEHLGRAFKILVQERTGTVKTGAKP